MTYTKGLITFVLLLYFSSLLNDYRMAVENYENHDETRNITIEEKKF